VPSTTNRKGLKTCVYLLDQSVRKKRRTGKIKDSIHL
jgi:hypothetical protein